MSLKKTNRLKGTLAFRLTLWYALIFSLSALVVFLAVFLLIRAVVHKQRDHSLRAELKEFSKIQSAEGWINSRRECSGRSGPKAPKTFFYASFPKMARSWP